MRAIRAVVLLLAMSPAGLGYLQRRVESSNANINPGSTVALHRPDFFRIAYLLNQSATGGLVLNGVTVISPGSNVPAAIQAALQSWNGVPTSAARFAPLQTTPLVNDPNDNQNVIVFRDSPDVRTAVGDALAVTNVIYNPDDGTTLDTDILFNPAKQFSTTYAPNTYDIQSVATHELGHALGADHTGVRGGTMYASEAPQQFQPGVLKDDDIAFVTTVYPSGTLPYGTLTGSVNAGGAALRGALITAVDAAKGVVIGGVTDFATGTFSFQVPAGNYMVYAEPLSGDFNIYSTYQKSADRNFQTAPAGGFGAPVTYPVTAGGTQTVNFQTPPGASALSFDLLATGTASLYTSSAQVLPVGTSTVLHLSGNGIDESLTEQNLLLLGPATIHPGSLKVASVTVDGGPVVDVTIDVPARANIALASLLVNKSGSSAAFTGGLVLAPVPSFPANGVANAFSYNASAVAPGEDISIFGVNLGPAVGMLGQFSLNAGFSTTLAGVTVSFDGQPAPMLFAAAGQLNVQVPYEVAGRSATRIQVNVNGLPAQAVTVPVAAAVPGLLTIIVNQDYSFNSTSKPAAAGDYLTLYVLGMGVTTPAVATNQIAPGQEPFARFAMPSVTIGGVNAGVAFAGLTPGLVGLGQINVRVPAGLPAGKPLPVVVTAAGGAQSQTGTSAPAVYVR